jgi:hypothetical protein
MIGCSGSPATLNLPIIVRTGIDPRGVSAVNSSVSIAAPLRASTSRINSCVF